MPTLNVNVPHSLGKEQAVSRLKERLNKAKHKFGQEVSDLEEQWDGNVLSFGFTTLGVKIRGTVTSAESEVAVAAKLPYAAMLFRRAIERQIRNELESILADGHA